MTRSHTLHMAVRASLATAAIAVALPVYAQDTERSSATLGEVVVTAQKREESLQEVTIPISVFTTEQRDQIGITTVVDMANFTPGFVYNTGQDRVSMRGIGRYTNQLGADSSVGVYEDGVFETFTVKAGNSSLYTDRIEVLRGPQGTLYGRASIGGAVNIVSRRPTEDWYGEVRLSYDNYSQRIIEGAVSGPITDNLLFRLAATKLDQTDGYFNNVGGGQDSGNVRDEWVYEGQLQWNITDSDQLWIKLFGGEWDNGGGNAGGRTTNQVVVGVDGNTPLPGGRYPANFVPGSTLGFQLTNNALIPSLGVGFLDPAADTLNPVPGVNPGNNNIRDFYSNYPQEVILDDYYGVVVHLSHEFSGAELKYIGGWQHYNYYENVEWGEGYILATGLRSYQFPGLARVYPNSLLFYQEDHTLNSNEINLVSTGDGPTQWVVGIYNFNQEFQQPESVYTPGQAELAAPFALALIPTPPFTAVTGPAPANPHRDVFYGKADAGARAWAAYGQADWEMTDAWKATFGARYENNWKWGKDSGSLFLFNPAAGVGLNLTQVAIPLGVAYPGATPAVYNAATGRAERDLRAEWDGFTVTAGVQWQPSDTTNVYAKYSRGFKSGGFNIGSGIVPNPRTEEETSNDFQLGYKQSFGNTFQLNVAVFYDQYYDAQIPIGTNTGGVVTNQFFNLPESRSSGVEIEATLQATRDLQFLFTYGYNDTSIVESGCLIDSSGDPTATRIGAQPGSCVGGSQDLKGNQLPNAPENKLAFNVNYNIDIGDGSLLLSASYLWRDKQYGSVFNRPYTEAPSWDQTDVRATYNSGDHLTLIAFCKNVFDDVGYSGGALAATQNDAVGNHVGFIKNYQLNPPRIYGMELQYKF